MSKALLLLILPFIRFPFLVLGQDKDDGRGCDGPPKQMSTSLSKSSKKSKQFRLAGSESEHAEATEGALLDLGASLYSYGKEVCLQFAVELDLGKRFFRKMSHAEFSDGFGLTILQRWSRVVGRDATHGALYAALLAINLKEAADEFEDFIGRNVSTD